MNGYLPTTDQAVYDGAFVEIVAKLVDVHKVAENWVAFYEGGSTAAGWTAYNLSRSW